MKKFRWLSLLCSLIMCFSVFGLAACDLGNLEPNDEIDPSDQVNASDYLKGITVIYEPEAKSEADKFVDGFTNTTMYFNQLLDRQFSMLADDILFRLYTVYGNTEDVNETISLKDKDSNNVTLLSGPTASYNRGDTILKYDGGYKLSNGNNANISGGINLTEPATYAAYIFDNSQGKYLLSYNSSVRSSKLTENFNFIGFDPFTNEASYCAIEGIKCSRDGENISFISDSSKAWKWSTPGYFKDRTSKYKDNLKMALSKVLSTGTVDVTDTYTSFNYDETAYQNNLSKIDHLGILNYDTKLIKQLIKYNIIGKDLIDEDNYALELLSNKFDITNFNKVIEKELYTTELDENALSELDKMHDYKAYELIVDSMVDTLVENAFTGTDVKIYTEMPRLQVKDIDYKDIDSESEPYWTTTGLQIKSIIYRPKQEMRLDVLIANFEQMEQEGTTYYANINITFVANGTQFKGSTTSTIKYGDQSSTEEREDSGSINPGDYSGKEDQELVDNTFEIEPVDLFEADLPEKQNGNVDQSALKWTAGYNGYEGIYSTINNPFEMVQSEESNSIASYYSAGNNYLELTFEYFTDEAMLNPCNETISTLKFRPIEMITFTWKDYDKDNTEE